MRQLILAPAHEVAERMAAKRITAQEEDVDQEDNRADAEAEVELAIVALELARLHDVPGEKQDKDQSQVQEIPVHILNDQRQAVLAPVALARLADGAVRRVAPPHLLVCTAAVRARDAKRTGC